jgi:hypothetical protein
MLWGAGTAIGEIPPYALSRAARLAGEENAELDELLHEQSQVCARAAHEGLDDQFSAAERLLGRAAHVGLSQRVFRSLRHVLRPLSDAVLDLFFAATFIGKALIKAPAQAAFFTMLFTDAFLQRFIHLLDVIMVPDASIRASTYRAEALPHARSTSCSSTRATSSTSADQARRRRRIARQARLERRHGRC